MAEPEFKLQSDSRPCGPDFEALNFHKRSSLGEIFFQKEGFYQGWWLLPLQRTSWGSAVPISHSIKHVLPSVHRSIHWVPGLLSTSYDGSIMTYTDAQWRCPWRNQESPCWWEAKEASNFGFIKNSSWNRCSLSSHKKLSVLNIISHHTNSQVINPEWQKELPEYGNNALQQFCYRYQHYMGKI